MKKLIIFLGAALVVGCASTTTIKSPDASQVAVNETMVTPGQSKEFSDTSFGQYKFKATDNSGSETFYGLLPLKFNGGYLALDILFFAPAMFFNLRSVYPEYEIAIAEGLIKYRADANDPWQEYRPTQAEQDHAKTYFMK